MSTSFYPSLRKVACLSTLVVAIGFASAAFAQNDSIYGETYHRESVVPQQAQIVLFRGNDSGKQAAHVYIDGQLHSALMPGGYTTFCVAPGEHSVETYIGDAPLYVGKRNPQSYAKLDGGQTYVLEAPVAPNQSTPIVHTGEDAKRSLQGLRKQIHVINRASAVVPCQVQTETKLTLRSDVLFKFGKSSYNDMTAQGHAELRKIVDQIGHQAGTIDGIDVVGHADPIGGAAYNQRLSEARAETVRRVMLDLGVASQLVHASGRGSNEPLVQCNSGSRSQRIACNEPNRRVELLIRGARSDQ